MKLSLKTLALSEVDFDLLDRVQEQIEQQDRFDARLARQTLHTKGKVLLVKVNNDKGRPAYTESELAARETRVMKHTRRIVDDANKVSHIREGRAQAELIEDAMYAGIMVGGAVQLDKGMRDERVRKSAPYQEPVALD